jgi:hypothetical protein
MTDRHVFARRAIVAVFSILRSAFDKLEIAACRALWRIEVEQGWFADTSSRCFGVLLLDSRSGRWGYNVCVKGEDDQFRRVAFAVDIPSYQLARHNMEAAMQSPSLSALALLGRLP